MNFPQRRGVAFLFGAERARFGLRRGELGLGRRGEPVLVLPGKRHQCDENQNGARQQNRPRTRDADRRDGSLPGEYRAYRATLRPQLRPGQHTDASHAKIVGAAVAHPPALTPLRAPDSQRGCQLGLSVKRPPSAKPMSYMRNTPNAKLIKPEATPSCQLNLGRLTDVKAKGATSNSVINVIPPIVPMPNRNR